MSVNNDVDERAESAENAQRVPNMLEINRFLSADGENRINFKEVTAALPKSVRDMLTSGFEMKKFAKIFEDESMMQTAEIFLQCGMNVSETSRVLYMHRNTLMYRLNRIKSQTGLDLSDFNMAVTFKLLHYLYLMK